MYTLFNTKSIWPPSPGPVNTGQAKMYYNTIPATPVMVDSGAGESAYSYQLQPGWYPPPAAPARRRLSSDDVFYPEGAYVYEEPVYSYVVTSRLPPQVFCAKRSRTIKPAKRAVVNPNSFESQRSPDTSRTGYTLAPEAYVTPKKYDYFSENSSNTSSNSNESSPSSQIKDDSLINTMFPSSSLYAALNSEPPEPKARVTFKTSSPIEGDSNALHIDIGKLRKRRGRFVTSSSSEKCPRFSENGVCEDLDQCDKILLKSRCVNSDEDKAQKREEFLLILEAERERQKKLVLPKHTPKMSCKFCKNNGEPPEVYTKHRLHFNEKTVCPLLRHYVCRLCRSTGDYAHTIGHCPFNSKKDKIAYKATFLV